MKSPINGTSARFRIAAAVVFSIILLFSSPAVALDYQFGEVEVNSKATVTLDIQNIDPNNEYNFGLSLASGSDSIFSLSSSQVTIPGDGVVQVQVTFAPTEPISYTDTIQIRVGTYLVQEMGINLYGTGIEAAAAAPADLSPMAAAMQRWASAVASRECNGKTIGDRVQECIESADNHGEAVRCVAKLAAQLRKERRISRWDAWEMRDYAAKSRYHHMHKKHWMHKKADFRETHEKKGRRWSNWD
ncbi:MAG: hypothetical protein K9L59_17315 [Desulfobacterales bacterium]|nr:hypothetical protein [Desulfobacterales bacterium]